MMARFTLPLLGLALAVTANLAAAQTPSLQFPKTVEAGSSFSVPTSGTGMGVLYIIGPAQVVRRSVQLGEAVVFAAGDLDNAGYYTAFLAGDSSSAAAEFDVISAHQPASLSFIAKPSRLPVGVHDGISGVVYVFDPFRNLLLQPMPVSFELSGIAGTAQPHTALTRDGVAWIKLDSAPKAGTVQLQARVGNITGRRVLQEVPGDPCNLRMSAHRSGTRIALETEPVRDCNGNPVPDGTIVSFTEKYGNSEATADVPLKRGVARTDVPARDGAVISVATGVVLGNQIQWRNGRP
jgi:hypothetical protein